MHIDINVPEQIDDLRGLMAGQEIHISGTIYSARDQAHIRMDAMLDRGEELPFDLKNTLIYYMGPTPAKPGEIVGSAGPTTSGRMDSYTPRLLELGLPGTIGKGPRDEKVLETMKKTNSVYFYAFGGCGALYAEHIMNIQLVAFDDLGPEAVYRLTVRDFPLILAADAAGNSIF